MKIDTSIFRAYDIRGVYPEQLNETTSYTISRAFADLVRKKTSKEKLRFVVGSDMRLSSPALKERVIIGLLDSGVDVEDIGVVSSPTFYFAVGYLKFDGGIQVSASHNPKEYNGLKIVFEKAMPVSRDTGIYDLRDMVVNDQLPHPSQYKGTLSKKENVTQLCVEKQTKNIALKEVKPLKIVIDPANAVGALDMEELFKRLPCKLLKMNFELNGSFPSHPADPMIPGNIAPLRERVVAEKADLGIGIDGDGDRYFFVDEKGVVVPQPIIRGLMAQIELREHPGATIAYDIRPGKITLDMIQEAGGKPLITPVGHSLIKKIMVERGAIYGGESSGHFAYKFDYGTFEAPIVEVSKFLVFTSQQNKPVSEIIAPYDIYCHSGEINMHLQKREDSEIIIERLKKKFSDCKQDLLDGLSVECENFWFNIRPSNTEALLRLAVEGISKEIVEQKVREIKTLL